MATTEKTGRSIRNYSNEVLILPQGGLPDPAPEGAIVLENGNLFVWTQGEWYKLTMTQADSGVSADSDAQTANGGVGAANGTYVNKGNYWQKGGGGTVYTMVKVVDYPEPGVNSWVIRIGADVVYVGTDTPLPWDAVWSVGSYGSPPIPTVIGLPKVQHATKSRK